ncbi:MAG: hypothetical protein U1D55_03820 [Phycisphaerae bacterium]
MRGRDSRCVCGLCLSAVIGIMPVGCVSASAAASLDELTSATLGSLSEILVHDYLTVATSSGDPQLDAPISQQRH